MGLALSKNVVENTLNAISNVSSSILARQNLESNQLQIIEVSDANGNVVISGNTQIQDATVNMEALMKAFTTQSATQDIVNQVTQAAKSLISGLNVAQASVAANETRNYIAAIVNLMNNIDQVCGASVGQTQTIRVTRANGDVFIQDNLQSQMASIFQSCVQDAVTNQKSVQALQNTVDQSAEATAKGLTGLAIAIIALVYILAPIIGVAVVGATAGKVIVKIIGLLVALAMLVAGVVFIILFSTTPPETMVTAMFSKGVNPTCGPVVGEALNPTLDTDTSVQDAQVVSFQRLCGECLNEKGCVAVDWQGLRVNQDGSLTPLSAPVAQKLSSLRENPCKSTLEDLDDTKLVQFPRLFIGSGFPSQDLSQSGRQGDVYVRTDDSTVFFFVVGLGFVLQEASFFDPKAPINNLTQGQGDPTVETPVGTYINSNFTDTIKLWEFSVDNTGGTETNSVVAEATSTGDGTDTVSVANTEATWHVIATVPGPGAVVLIPEEINASAFKVQPRKFDFLLIGISLAVLGLIGTAVFGWMLTKAEPMSTAKSKNPNSQDPEPPKPAQGREAPKEKKKI